MGGVASAGDVALPVQPAKQASDARCGALGQGFLSATGADACIRISGYVAAGGEISGGLRGGPAPFGSIPGAAIRARAGAAEARFDAPIGPGRISVDFGRDNLSP